MQLTYDEIAGRIGALVLSTWGMQKELGAMNTELVDLRNRLAPEPDPEPTPDPAATAEVPAEAAPAEPVSIRRARRGKAA